MKEWLSSPSKYICQTDAVDAEGRATTVGTEDGGAPPNACGRLWSRSLQRDSRRFLFCGICVDVGRCSVHRLMWQSLWQWRRLPHWADSDLESELKSDLGRSA